MQIFNNKFFFKFRVVSRLVFIPFIVGPRSPNGLEQQQQAEATLKANYDEAPMALGPLLAINVAEVINDSKGLKCKLAEMYPDVDDRICENYGILLAMARKVNKNYKVMKHHNFLIDCLKEIANV